MNQPPASAPRPLDGDPPAADGAGHGRPDGPTDTPQESPADSRPDGPADPRDADPVDPWPDGPTGLRQRVAVYAIVGQGPPDGERVLLVRAASYLTVAGRWFLPGGGIDHGEDPVAALRRECREETGLEVEVGPLRGVLSDLTTLPDGSSLHTVRIIYAITTFDGELHHETDGSTDLARWVDLEEALGLPLMPYVRRALTELR